MECQEYRDRIIEEIEEVLEKIDPSEINELMEAIIEADNIQLFGMGRVGYSIRAFSMRLTHLGLNSFMVWDTNTPAIGKKDLLVAGCGCTTMGEEVIKLSKEAGAKVALITPSKETKAAELADIVINLPGQITGENEREIQSMQPMATLFEQTLFLTCDLIVLLLMDRLEVSEKEMEERHTNLEGFIK